MITFPNAKINLGLNIVERRPDGYHNLETIFYPIKLQDALEVNRLEHAEVPYKLRVSGANLHGSPEDNLVVKALNLLRQHHSGILPVDIHLFKHIPTEAGLGGGSADCAFMIKLLNEKFRLGLSVKEMDNMQPSWVQTVRSSSRISQSSLPAQETFSNRLNLH